MKNIFISTLILISIGLSAQVSITNQGRTASMIEQRLEYIKKPFDSLKLYDSDLCSTIIYDAARYPDELLCLDVYEPEDSSYIDVLYETSKYKVFIHTPEYFWDYEGADTLDEEYLIFYPLRNNEYH